MKVALYARVSKGEEQDPETQLLELRRWAREAGEDVHGEFVDRVSSRDSRPQKEEVLCLVRLGVLEGVAFVSLDRWGRNLSELVLEMEEFDRRGVALISLKEGLRYDSAMARLYANLIAMFANFERDRISERTIAGLERARAWGKILGRHPVGCGCGKVVRKARGRRKKRHDGPVKPVRDEANRHVGWSYPDGTFKPVGWARRERAERARKQTGAEDP